MNSNTPTRLQKITYDIVGERQEGAHARYVVIGTAESFAETCGPVTKTTFVLNIEEPPINFARTFMVPQSGVELDVSMLTTYRICDSSDRVDGGGDFQYGIGTLNPIVGPLSKTSSYYAMQADPGTVLWKCGQFLALLDPRESEAFFTLSDATSGDTFEHAA